MNLTAFLLSLFILQAVCLIAGRHYSKGLKNQDDYFLASKSLRFFPLMMTFIATQVGGGLILGSAEEAYKFGWSVILFTLGTAFGLIVLGMGIGRRFAQMRISTIAQIFELVYRSSKLKQLASVLSIISLFMIFVAQIIASQKFMLSLGIENPLWFFAFWGAVIIYTAAGGLKAVVATDIVQALFFITIFLLSFGYVVFAKSSSFLLNQTPPSEGFLFEPLKFYSWLLMPLLFMLVGQDMGQRCFAADSPKTVTKATLCAGLCTLLITFIPIFFGVLAKNLGLDIPPGASVLMTVVKETTTPLIAALVGCAVLAAIISTADSLINAISSNLGQDFNLSLTIRSSQIMTAFIALGGIAFSFYFTSVVDVLLQSYELSVSCLFVPILFALFKKQGHSLSASLAIGFGAAGFVLFRIVFVPIPKEIASLLLSFAGFYLGELLLYNRAKFSLERVIK